MDCKEHALMGAGRNKPDVSGDHVASDLSFEE
jgi:hypothetical protein